MPILACSFHLSISIGAIEAVCALAGSIRPILQVSEIRRVAADWLWMSMNYEEDSVAIHFTWKREHDGKTITARWEKSSNSIK